MEVFDLLNANQYGFRRQRGTIDASAHFVENARDTLENQPKCSIGLFLDLKKAFDTVDHNLLLRKIANIGLRGPMLEIMKVLFQSDIDNIGLYLSDNKLTLNVEKTINLNLGFKTMMNVLRLNKATPKKSNQVKYLGVLLDNKLDFKKHINSVAAKLTKFTGMFYKLRFILSIEQLVLVYKSFNQPVIQYGVLIYGTANKSSLKFIEVKIKQITQIVFRKQSHQ